MLIAIPLQKTVKSQIESDKLQFEKQNWDCQLAMDGQKQKARLWLINKNWMLSGG